MACVDVVQALTTPRFGPLQPEADAQVSRDHVADGARDVERRGLLWVVSSFPGDRLVFDAREAADA